MIRGLGLPLSRLDARRQMKQLVAARPVGLTVILVLAGALSGCEREEASQYAGCTAINHVTVIDPSAPAGQSLRPNQTVLICGDRIRSVGSARGVGTPKGARGVDGSGKFLIPGLWDMHVHLSAVGTSSAPLFLAFGVTSVRDCGSEFGVLQDWRSQIAAGTLAGPRIMGAGAVLESQRFLEAVNKIAGKLEPDLGKSLREIIRGRIGVTSVADAKARVDSLKAKGADFIKVRNAESPEILYAIAEEAKKDSLPLAGHVIRGADLAKASEAGQTSVEHDEDFLDSKPAPITPKQRTELGAEFARNGTVLVPTIVARRSRLAPDREIQAVLKDTVGTTDPMRRYLSPELLHFWKVNVALKKFDEREEGWESKLQKGEDFVRAMRETGVEVLPGTDLGVPLLYPGTSLLEELGIFVDELGMTPLQALNSATVLPARWFGLGGQLGTIAPGKLADLVLLDANPLEDIRHLRQVAGVMANGRYVDRTHLDRLLAEIASPASVRR